MHNAMGCCCSEIGDFCLFPVHYLSTICHLITPILSCNSSSLLRVKLYSRVFTFEKLSIFMYSCSSFFAHSSNRSNMPVLGFLGCGRLWILKSPELSIVRRPLDGPAVVRRLLDGPAVLGIPHIPECRLPHRMQFLTILFILLAGVTVSKREAFRAVVLITELVLSCFSSGFGAFYLFLFQIHSPNEYSS